MTDLPLSKLKIKIHALDNPTSVFKKRNLLSLNCINKTNSKKKSITPLRTYTSDVPHYMLPIKSNLNKDNYTNNNKNKKNVLRPSPHLKTKKFSGRLKIFKNDSKIKLPRLSREKSDNILYTKVNLNNKNTFFKKINPGTSMPDFNNNINNSFHDIKMNDGNMNLNVNNSNANNDNIVYNRIKNNLYSNATNNNNNTTNNNNYSTMNHYLNDDMNNDMIIYTEHNNNNYQSINNNSSDSNNDKNIPKQFQSIIAELQKKINDQNLLLSERIKEIEYLKKQINDNHNEEKNNYYENIEYMNNLNEYKNENEYLNKEIERYKSLLNDYKKNNQEKNQQNELNHEMIQKLQEELKSLKDNIKSLSDKYQTELSNNKVLEEKYNYIKNNMRTPEELAEKYENKIYDQEKKIADLEEEIYQLNKKKEIIKKSKLSFFEILGNANSENNKKEKSETARTLAREFIVKIEVVDGKMSSNNNFNNDELGNENVVNDGLSKRLMTISKNSNSSRLAGGVYLNNNLILNEKEYNKIQLLLNILLIINGINEEILTEKIKQLQNQKKRDENQINKIINDICDNLKIINID